MHYRLTEAEAILTRELQYDLPPERIAQRPVEPRDAARLLVADRASQTIRHRTFRDLVEYLEPGDVLVLNRTRVLPARFAATRSTGGRVRGLFIREIEPGEWEVMLAPLRRIHQGEQLSLGDGRWSLMLKARLNRGLCRVTLTPPDAANTVLDAIGMTPLPPYIGRDEAVDLDQFDRSRYQTVYADRPGAVAAPTAGLHFTPALFEQLAQKGVARAQVTLHVGPGTFAPIEVDDLAQHAMHREWYECPIEAVEPIRAASERGGRVVAVGTTSVRVLETAATDDHRLRAGEGWTDIFIYPPHRFKAVDALVTNFHLPGSTLLALVYAFGGVELMRRAYQAAIDQNYRFYSYGDAMLIV